MLPCARVFTYASLYSSTDCRAGLSISRCLHPHHPLLQHDLRPGVHHLLRLAPHYRLGIYSSATRPTVSKALLKLHGNLANFVDQVMLDWRLSWLAACRCSDPSGPRMRLVLLFVRWLAG